MSARAEGFSHRSPGRDVLEAVPLWVGAVVAALIPGIIALDSGGILPWSYWAVAVAVFAPAVLGCASLGTSSALRGIRPHLFTLLLLSMALFALLQTVPLPVGLVDWLSPGSNAAWTDWLPSATQGSVSPAASGWIPISVAPYLTRQTAAIFVVMAAFAWCGSTLFGNRGRIAWLLAALAVTGAVHAVIGFWQVFLFPGYTFWGIDVGSPFGVYVNRNNSALILNLSLAASLGLIGWRLAAVTGHEFGQQGFTFSSLLDLISDRMSVLAFASCVLDFGALLASGSRGGLAGAVLGGALALGLLRQSHIARRIIWIVLIGVAVAFLLLARVDVNPRTLERFGASADGIAESILSDQRLPHWQDSLNATSHYLPLGSGFGTYRYAYLPYEQIGTDGWAVNADNLWLEWLLEAGVFGALALICGLGLLIYALLQLRQTADPIDHGIATAGWCALGAIAVSQSFDFGLLLAGAGSAASLLFGAILGRAATEGTALWRPEREAGRRLQFVEDTRPAYGSFVLGVGLVVALLVATMHLNRSARVDSAVRLANLAESGERAEMVAANDALQGALALAPSSADGWYALARLHLAMADSVAAEMIGDSPMINALDPEIESGSLLQLKRLLVVSRLVEASDAQQGERMEAFVRSVIAAGGDHYERAREAALEALRNSPLAAGPRFLLIRLDVAEPHSDSGALADQILRLRRAAFAPLRSLATTAAVSQDWETATRAWRSILERRPSLTTHYLRVAESLDHPRSTDIVPDRVEALVRAAEVEVNKPLPDLEFLSRVQEKLSTGFPSDRMERAERYALLGRIEGARGRVDEQVEMWRKAALTDPRDPALRIGYGRALVTAGELAQAKRVALEARDALGDPDGRLDRFLRGVQSLIDQSQVRL